VRQQTLAAQTGFEKYGRKSKREQFLDEMERIVPWAELQALVEPYYPKGENGRPPVGLSIMLCVYFLQQWFNLSDPGAEEALYESPVVRRFAGVDLGRAPAPDETTILQFRHRLERHDLGGAMLERVNQYLESRGIRINRSTIVDATIIHAPSSTKNGSGERDPEMHQTRKGKQWYFGLKAHIGVDSKEGHVHSLCTSAASVADKHMLPDLLHGEERKVWGDSGYQGQREAIRWAAPQAQDMTSRRAKYKNFVDELEKTKNRVKARGRAKVEHPFRILKRIFGLREGEVPGIEEESPATVHLLRTGEPVSAPQATGSRIGGSVTENRVIGGFQQDRSQVSRQSCGTCGLTFGRHSKSTGCSEVP
jgi:transposase, IS5 family